MQLGVEVRGHRQELVIHNTLQNKKCKDGVRGHRRMKCEDTDRSL